MKSVIRTGGKVVRFGGRTVGRVGMGALKFGTKAASHVIVTGVGTLAKIGRSIARS